MPKPSPSRRTFLQSTAATAAAGAVLLPARSAHAAGGDTLKIGLVGCGGRGSGAAINALAADKGVRLVAIADAFQDRIDLKLKEFTDAFPDRVDVPKERQYTGFDGYKQLIDSGVDVVLLCTPPGFRPLHLAYAVEKNKHVFMEKPHAVDPAGIRSVLASVKVAKEKNLGLVSGFCYRYDDRKRETLKRIHGGQIGTVQVVHTTYLTGELWYRGDDPKWSEMEYQMRNWYYYTWLSGDFNVEQHIHSIDKAAWVMNGELPVACSGMGGRQSRTDKKYGNIYDHFTAVYEYASGAKVFSQCRQAQGCAGDVNDLVYGTKGTANLMRHAISNDGGTWKWEGKAVDMYQSEHNELFASIRAGKPLNDGEASAYSTLMGIMGREAAYTGKKITWKEMLESKLDLTPKAYAWGENPVPPVAVPGKTKFV